MNKFNKLFRKSVQLTPQQQQQLQGSPPLTSSSSSLSTLQNHGGGGGHLTSSVSSPNLLSSLANSGGSSSGSSASISSSASTSFSSYQKLPLIDFDQLFLQFLTESDILRCCFLVHSISTGKKISKSWQPFSKKNSNAAFLLVCSRFLLVIDASTQPLTLQRRLPISDLKEMLIDSSDVGLFSIQLNKEQFDKQHNHPLPSTLYFSTGSEKREYQDQIVAALEEVTKEYFLHEHKGGFVVRRCNMLSGEQTEQKKELKDAVLLVLDELSLMGFTGQDLWDGDVDLKLWVDKIRHLIKPNNDERFVVEFVLPDSAYDTSGVCKKVFRVPNNISIKEIQIQNSNDYTLCTIKGREVDPEDTLLDYGLGSLFDNWQLCLTERGKVRKAGLFELEVHYPEIPEFAGRFHRITVVDGYQPAEVVVKNLGKEMEIGKPHLFSIKLETPSGVQYPQDHEFLTKYGLGSKFRKCKLKLIPKKFPKASSNRQQNYNITKSIMDDIIENAYHEMAERSELKKKMVCKEIMDWMIDIAVEECVRASTLTVRMASLSSISRAAMYKFLVVKEQEDINHYKIAGQKRAADDAKDLIHGLMHLSGPSAFINLENQQEAPSLQVRVPPPPPPPILGFQNFKKRLDTVTPPIQEKQSTRVGGGNSNMANVLDMNQILNMRGKLKATQQPTKKDEKEDAKFDESQELVLKSVKLRPTANGQIPVTNSKETTELMQKLQKRNAAVQSFLVEAEDLGDA
ncbi:hypothetical protein PPL_09533 [Heterostelium album PN500]|uniref:Uncharacterized protein n=1 Tax=Heterostelium pallidum (strain ATCC 26659 / Pp 5 / PN500) TaxID=670386 RepID=D3BNC2_HETP5|nr:hypothetical protein PPL_09533 [Heterostelium album PN500]EFA76782.1 hypothetical protein PPL_09533 [Heterostelium album PN500]|eukprot:XP_020428914.1 hypothetical protein PPL_09533 [Heterostelium album PN500]